MWTPALLALYEKLSMPGRGGGGRCAAPGRGHRSSRPPSASARARGSEEDALDIDVEDLVKPRLGELVERCAPRCARVVEQCVDRVYASAGIACTGPSGDKPSTAAASSASLRPDTYTFAPARRRPRAIISPIPRPPPGTTATFPSRRNRSVMVTSL